MYHSIGDKLDYDEVTAKIRSVVSNKVAMMAGPDGRGEDRLRRRCPSVANDGKGGKALGKGHCERRKGKGLSTKSGQKGDSRRAKGFGKGGFKGSRFRCGQQEHRANESRTHSANAVEEEDEEEAVPLGGVWMVGAVDEYEDENAWVIVKDEWLAKGFNAKQDVEVQTRARR